MKRREFLERVAASGVLLSMPALLEECGVPASRAEGLDPSAGKDEPLLFVLRAGTTAPNPHNTQAWRFRIRNPMEADLFVDASRLLPDTDPPARQIHIGQGTFLEHAAIAGPEVGCAVKIMLFPEGDYALSGIGTKPVARIILIRSAAVARDPLFAETARRITNRSPYSGPAISSEEFSRLQALTSSRGSELSFFQTGTREASMLIPYLKGAFTIETNTLATNEETRRWFRFNDQEIYRARDGISLRSNGMSGATLFVASHFLVENSATYWNAEGTKRYSIEVFEKQADTARGFVIFKTRSNTFRDHVLVGRDYARFHLAATSLGLSMQPMSQVLQEYSEMTTLREGFERWIGVAGEEKIQMIARLGRSDFFFRSPRRDLQSMMG